jgi:hypothetical protein
MGLLRLIHAGRLAPLEELLADLGDTNGNGGATKSSTARASALPASTHAGSGRNEIANAAAHSGATPLSFSSPAWSKRPETLANRSEVATSVVHPIIADEKAAEREAASESSNAQTQTASNISELAPEATVNRVAAGGLSEEQVAEIRGTIQAQQKFLGELLEHAHRWELEGAELRIFFATEKRAFAEMVEGRDSLEKIRAVSGKVLNRSVRVCAKMESVAAAAANASQAASGAKELREKFERDPMVRSMLQRFGGRISEVKRREEVS